MDKSTLSNPQLMYEQAASKPIIRTISAPRDVYDSFVYVTFVIRRESSVFVTCFNCEDKQSWISASQGHFAINAPPQ